MRELLIALVLALSLVACEAPLTDREERFAGYVRGLTTRVEPLSDRALVEWGYEECERGYAPERDTNTAAIVTGVAFAVLCPEKATR